VNFGNSYRRNISTLNIDIGIVIVVVAAAAEWFI